MIYLDNSATTRVCDSAASAALRGMTEEYYNISSPYARALATQKETERALSRIAALLGASPAELLVTSGGTESDNTALACAPENSEIIVSAGEHHAILNCIPRLEKQGHTVHVCPMRENGQVDLDALSSLLSPRTGLVSVMQVNNEVGAVNDLKAVRERLDRVNPSILLHSDGVQGFMHVCTDVKSMGIDLYSVSGHKLHAIKGVGLLYVGKRVPFVNFVEGGGQQNNRRSGTFNVPGLLSLDAALAFLKDHEDFSSKLLQIKNAYAERLLEIPDARLLCPESAPHILSISFPGVKASTLQTALEQEVLIGKGSACTSRSSKISHVLEAMGVDRDKAESTVRLSFGAFNTLEEVDRACGLIREKITYYRKFKRK